MRVNRGLLNWGVFFIALGGIPLAVDQGWLEPDIASELSQLWPLILVGIGLGLILRWTALSWFGGALVAATFGVIFGAAIVSIRDNDFSTVQGIIPAIAGGTCANSAPGDETTSDEGIASGEAFSLEVSLPCGELTVMRGADTTWRVNAAHDADDAPRIDVTEGVTGTTGLRLSPKADGNLTFIGSGSRSKWDVVVPAEAALVLRTTLDASQATIDAGAGPVTLVDATLNAADATIDLSDVDTPDTTTMVQLTLNASDGRLLLPVGTAWASATLNASSLDVCVPAAVPLQVNLSETLSSSDLAQAGLVEAAESTWATPGFSQSGDHAVLEIESTVSSLSIERPEACS